MLGAGGLLIMYARWTVELFEGYLAPHEAPLILGNWYYLKLYLELGSVSTILLFLAPLLVPHLKRSKQLRVAGVIAAAVSFVAWYVLLFVNSPLSGSPEVSIVGYYITAPEIEKALAVLFLGCMIVFCQIAVSLKPDAVKDNTRCSAQRAIDGSILLILLLLVFLIVSYGNPYLLLLEPISDGRSMAAQPMYVGIPASGVPWAPLIGLPVLGLAFYAQSVFFARLFRLQSSPKAH